MFKKTSERSHMSSTKPIVRSPRRAAGFTVVEMAVAVGVLGIMCALLAPALGSGRAAARRAICVTHLHAIGQAAIQYANDNGGYVPRDYWYGCNDPAPENLNYAHYLFAAKLSKYVSGPDIPYELCDSYPYLYNTFKTIPTYQCAAANRPDYALQYVVNGIDFKRYQVEGVYHSSPTAKLTAIPGAASDVAYLAEANFGSLPSMVFGDYDIQSVDDLTYTGITPNPHSRVVASTDTRHGPMTPVAMFDSSVRIVPISPAGLPASLFNPFDRSTETAQSRVASAVGKF